MVLNTVWNVEKMVEILKERKIDTIFVNLPVEFESYLKDLHFKSLQRMATFYMHDLEALNPLMN